MGHNYFAFITAGPIKIRGGSYPKKKMKAKGLILISPFYYWKLNVKETIDLETKC